MIKFMIGVDHQVISLPGIISKISIKDSPLGAMVTGLRILIDSMSLVVSIQVHREGLGGFVIGGKMMSMTRVTMTMMRGRKEMVIIEGDTEGEGDKVNISTNFLTAKIPR